MTTHRKWLPLLAISIFTAMAGLRAYSSVADSPRFESFRGIDVVRLMAAGASFSFAAIALLLFFIRPDFRSADKTTGEKGGQDQIEGTALPSRDSHQ